MVAQYSDDVQKAMQEAELRHLRLLALVGYAALTWNSVEEALERLIWYYLGSDEIGHIVTSKMQNMGRCDVLKNLVDARESVPEIRVRADHFVAAFDILRINRNFIIHSVQFTPNREGTSLNFGRLKKSFRTREYDAFSMPVEKLEELADQMADLDTFGETLLKIMKCRSGLMKQSLFAWPQPPPWPEIFPLPERLS